MNRFFVPGVCIQTQRVVFPTDLAHQIYRVLRLHPQEHVLALDNEGGIFEVELDIINSTEVSGQIIKRDHGVNEALTQITLYLGLTQREKFELILQKCTEVGVRSFVPLITRRSLVQSGRDVENKIERWQRILREAAEQSERDIIPELKKVQSLSSLAKLASDEAGFVLWEEEAASNFRAALNETQNRKISLLIGPEGGLSDDEVKICKQAGFQPVSLGKRIFRMETAAIVAAAVTLFANGDMDI
ncbi:MAG: 16S rRNA (uracil(1498)-N(3))-methyltransferase [Anaerolineae bacterium]|nr:16S rRNA (uracil(1498)-N(3))-methyltransferase [Anaerolineae bacterium]